MRESRTQLLIRTRLYSSVALTKSTSLLQTPGETTLTVLSCQLLLIAQAEEFYQRQWVCTRPPVWPVWEIRTKARKRSQIQLNSSLQSLTAIYISEVDICSPFHFKSKISLLWWQVCSGSVPTTWETPRSADFRTKTYLREPSKWTHPYPHSDTSTYSLKDSILDPLTNLVYIWSDMQSTEISGIMFAASSVILSVLFFPPFSGEELCSLVSTCSCPPRRGPFPA